MSTIYSFDTEHAKKYGTNEAVILYNIIFWIKKNKANNKHLHHGKHWTYNSIQAFNELFDFLTKDQIRRCIDKLEAKGAIVKDNFNEHAYDRTLWYTLSDELYYKHISSIQKQHEKDVRTHLAFLPNGYDENAKCHLAKMPNGYGENAKPIPDFKPDFNQTYSNHTQEKYELLTLCMLIHNSLGEIISKQKVQELIMEYWTKTVKQYLYDLDKYRPFAKRSQAAYFIYCVQNQIPIPTPTQANFNKGDKIPQRDNFDQREYTDEEMERYYANLTEDDHKTVNNN